MNRFSVAVIFVAAALIVGAYFVRARNLTHRWRLWKLKRTRKKIRKSFANKFRKLRDSPNRDQFAFAELESCEHFENQMLDEALEHFRSSYLINEALNYDVDIPSATDNKELWQYTEDGESWFLNRKGREVLEGLIGKRKDHVAEGWVRFGKTFVPIIVALASLAAALTGLVTALTHSK